MIIIFVYFKKLKPSAITPNKGSSQAAGYDLSACIDEPITIQPHETVKVGTGLAICPPKGYFGAIFPRSGLATKQGLRLANSTGICDEDYRGEYIIAIHNDSNEVRTISNGDRIAQLIFLPYLNYDFFEVEDLGKTERGAGGFGSTGV